MLKGWRISIPPLSALSFADIDFNDSFLQVLAVMETVSDLTIDLARIVVVRSSKSQAVIDQQVTVGHVQYGNRSRETLPEGLAQADIKGCVARQVAARDGGITIGKT